jgi:helix-turn-helix protein
VAGAAQAGTVAKARTAVEALMEATRRLESDQDATVPELQELRLGALADHDLRVLFVAEPQGAVLLLAAARGELGDKALRLAYDPASGGGEETEESFLSAFFPGEEAERWEGAARLTGRDRTHALEDARIRTGLTVEQVAERMGTTPERVAAIERAVDTVEVGVLAAYVEVLGGRLEVVAGLGSERVGLR